MKRLRLAFYGDDFTGSTDVMETLCLAGVPAGLFLEPPSPELLAAEYPHLEAVGVAGLSRMFSPGEMDRVLPPVFRDLGALQPEFVHYKVCSTFDSSPRTGSIGHAIELGRSVFGRKPVPVVVGAPRLRRYVVFGHLFATVAGVTHRLDRHPTMSRHPVTPMGESDLARHLAAQSDLGCEHVDLLALEGGGRAVVRALERAASADAGVVIFDTVNESHLALVGATLCAPDPLALGRFIVGSSGVEHALILHWTAAGEIVLPPQPTGQAVRQLLVFSGSASPVTQIQIERAQAAGYEVVRLDWSALLHPDQAFLAREKVVTRLCALLEGGVNVIAFAALGPDDPALAATRRAAEGYGIARVDDAIGSVQGELLGSVLRSVRVPRVAVVGGDTSGRVCSALGVTAIEFVAPIAPGAPLCRARLRDGTVLEFALKGGQNGSPDFFESLRLGRLDRP